jgi:TPR repeat protein
MKKTTLAMLILCASLALPAQAGFDEGLAAYNRGDYATAFKEWQPLAVAGNATAQYNLGVMYREGQGVPQDYKEAVKWFRLAAEQGDAYAQNNLGVMYREGRGVPQDYKEAVKWYRLAAEQGDAIAQNDLGVMYTNGQGVPQDYKEAVKWYRKAAEQGNAAAQSNLGVMYERGQGVPQDKVLAYALYNLSAAGDPSSNNNATGNRDAIVKKMSPREIEAGQALTRELSQPGNFGKALDAYLKKAEVP